MEGSLLPNPAKLGSRPIVSNQVVWDLSADMVVAGSGAAAFSAAITAASLGARVIMLEKAKTIGGTTARAGGGQGNRASSWIWIPNNSLMRQHGLSDPKLGALRYMARLSRPERYNPNHPVLGLPEDEYELIETFYDKGAEACDYLSNLGALQLGFREGGVDYYPELPENKAPTGRAFYIRNDDQSEGTGADLIARMQAKARQLGIEIRTDQRVCQALLENGRVVGVEAQNQAGDIRRYRALKGVVFGTGGFTHNETLRLNYLAGPTFGGPAASTNEGDVIPIATSLGAALGNMNHAWYSPIVLDYAPYPRSTAWKLPGDSMIAVNKYGRRVMNEKATYNEMTRTFFEWDAGRAEYPNLLLFMIYDQSTAERYCDLEEEAPQTEGGGNPIPKRGLADAHEIKGATLEELVVRIGERLEHCSTQTGGVRLAADFLPQLKETIAQFNRYAQAGFDPDFNRGEALIDRARHGPSRFADMKNPTIYPIASQGPYYAVILVAGMLDTKGGPKVNAHAQVVDSASNPIAGLYAAGNCMASPSGAAYWGGGATLGPAITFGYLAARHAVKGAYP